MIPKNQQLVQWLNLVPYFRNHPNSSIFEAAADLGITHQEVKQALDALMCTGVGNYTEDLIDLVVKPQGVAILDDQGLDKPLRLTPTEASALLLTLETLEQVPGLVDPTAVRSAAAKLRGIMDPKATAIVDSLSESESALSQMHAQLDQAVHDSRQVRFDYRSAATGTTSARQVHPARLFLREGDTYLIAWSDEHGEHRTYRIDRMSNLEILDAAANPHLHALEFDPDNPFGYSQLDAAEVELHPEYTWLAPEYGITLAAAAGPDTGTTEQAWVRGTLPIATEQWLVRFALSHADRLRIVGPENLVNAVAAAQAAAQELYT
ncbi:helix-turn-helix transcriptional regulator [Corynebacterium lizhenjunii]|uniref:helix-turn-helix transcriptional regulator n=1 Tax=Corynebacterium lizhenjunii TaxID=2709394 RepID=UPI0013EC2F7E|nr:WYL domain-containing protein [Corynebacterium lizhenjunii]